MVVCPLTPTIRCAKVYAAPGYTLLVKDEVPPTLVQALYTWSTGFADTQTRVPAAADAEKGWITE